MTTKIVPFGTYFEIKKQSPLSSLMMVSLLSACDNQKNNIPICHSSVTGSFTALVRRGLITIKEVIKDGKIELLWQVTPEAIDMLNVSTAANKHTKK